MRHAKEVVEILERVVSAENIQQIILAGDEVIIPTLREQMPHQLKERVVDTLRLDITTPEHEVLAATLEALREQDIEDDAEKVERLLDEYRAGGLAVLGAHDTLLALSNAQVDELIISAGLEEIHDEEEEIGTPLVSDAPITEKDRDQTRTVMVADELVTRARQTGANISFIEEASLLADVGGIGAMLRYQL